MAVNSQSEGFFRGEGRGGPHRGLGDITNFSGYGGYNPNQNQAWALISIVASIQIKAWIPINRGQLETQTNDLPVKSVVKLATLPLIVTTRLTLPIKGFKADTLQPKSAECIFLGYPPLTKATYAMALQIRKFT